MIENADRELPETQADSIEARVTAIELMVVIMLSRSEFADFGLLDSLKDEMAEMASSPSRKNDPRVAASDAAAAALIERAIKTASLNGGPMYRLKLRARRIVQKWRGPRRGGD